MDRRRDEVVAEGEHPKKRRQPRDVPPEIVGIEPPLRQGRAGGGFHRDDIGLGMLPGYLRPRKREREAGEVRAAADAPDHHIGGVGVHSRKLLLCLLADDRLVEADMVEDGTEGVVGVLVGGCVLDRLGYGDPEGARRIRVAGEDGLAGPGLLGRARDALGAVDLHHALTVGLLVVGTPNHVDGALHIEEARRKRERRPPPLPPPVSVASRSIPPSSRL